MHPQGDQGDQGDQGETRRKRKRLTQGGMQRILKPRGTNQYVPTSQTMKRNAMNANQRILVVKCISMTQYKIWKKPMT
jgi:hypothetical protein